MTDMTENTDVPDAGFVATDNDPGDPPQPDQIAGDDDQEALIDTLVAGDEDDPSGDGTPDPTDG